MTHEGCILPFLAHGRCPICGGSKDLLPPEGIQIRTLKCTVPWEGLWKHLQHGFVWNLFAIRKPEDHKNEPGNYSCLWLPFFFVSARGEGESMVCGERFESRGSGNRRIWTSSRNTSGQRQHYKVEGYIHVDGLVYASTVPLSRKVLAFMGIERRVATLKSLMACQTEPLGPEHQVPYFEYPTDYSKLDELGQEAIVQDVTDKFYQSVDLAFMLHHGIRFDEVKVDVLLVPVHVGSIRGGKTKDSKVRYAFLGVGGGMGITDLPLSYYKRKAWNISLILASIMHWVGLFAIAIGSFRGLLLIYALGVPMGIMWCLRLAMNVYDKAVQVNDPDDQVAIDHFARL